MAGNVDLDPAAAAPHTDGRSLAFLTAASVAVVASGAPQLDAESYNAGMEDAAVILETMARRFPAGQAETVAAAFRIAAEGIRAGKVEWVDVGDMMVEAEPHFAAPRPAMFDVRPGG